MYERIHKKTYSLGRAVGCWVCVVLATMPVSGCLSKTHFAADQAFAATVQQSVVMIEQYMDIADDFIAAKHAYQEEIASLEQQVFWSRHTDEAGRAVSVDDDGAIVPMAVEQIIAANDVFKESILNVSISRAVAEELKLKLRIGLDSLRLVSQQHSDGILSDAEAMGRLQAIMNTATGAGSAIAVAAIGAL